MNKRDLLMITGIAILLLAAVSGFELALRGVPEIPQAVEQRSAGPSLSVRSRSNVRAGDSTAHPIVSKLQVGEAATILGVSAGNTGWYFIELPDGTRGFISPDVVTTQGDLTHLERIEPASLSASATPPPSSAEPTQPVATTVATEPTDEAQPVTPTASG